MKKLIIILSITFLATQNICAMDDIKTEVDQFIDGESRQLEGEPSRLENALQQTGINSLYKTIIYCGLANKIELNKNNKVIFYSFPDLEILISQNGSAIVEQMPIAQRGSRSHQVLRAQMHISDFLQKKGVVGIEKIGNLRSALDAKSITQEDQETILLDIHQQLLNNQNLKTVETIYKNLILRLYRGDRFEIQEVPEYQEVQGCSTPQKAIIATAIIVATAAVSGLVYHKVWKPLKARWQQCKTQQKTTPQPTAQAA